MDPFTAVSLGITAVGAVTKMIDGFSQKKRAKEKMRQLEQAALPTNAFEGMEVPTEGIDLAREGIERGVATQTQALREAGVRGLMGGLGRVQQGAQQGYRELGAQYSDMLYDKEIAIAEEDANIQRVAEARLQGQIKQAGEQYAGAREQIMSGVSDIASVAGQFGNIQGLETAQSTGQLTAAKKDRQSDRLKRQYTPSNVQRFFGAQVKGVNEITPTTRDFSLSAPVLTARRNQIIGGN